MYKGSMLPHPESDRLARALSRCLDLAGRWAGDLFRFAAPRWATAEHLLTGAGALQAGGRWHPLGGFPAVYLSLSPETALAESLAHYHRFAIPLREAMPRTLNAVVAHFHNLLDLTDDRVRRRLRLSRRRMVEEKWWQQEAADPEALTQALGRIAHEIGLEALLVPSAAVKNGAGIVYFPDRLQPATTIHIVNPDELPRALS